MRTMPNVAAILIAVACTASLQAQTTPIDNSKRPGAGAPNCAKLPETADKCVFHTKKDQIDTVRLLAPAGVTWKATVSNSSQVKVGESKFETLTDGKRQQVIQVIPQTPGDADVVLTLEKRSQADANAAATETRSVNLMIHSIAL